jgi:hypothetical protein
MILQVAYDLHNPGRDYDAVAKQLKTASGGYTHVQGSVWLIDTANEPAWWRAQLRDCGDRNDEYLVTRLRKHWAGFGLKQASVRWSKSEKRRW